MALREWKENQVNTRPVNLQWHNDAQPDGDISRHTQHIKYFDTTTISDIGKFGLLENCGASAIAD